MAHVSSDGILNLGFCRSMDVEANIAARVTKDDLRVSIPMWCVGDIPELTAAHGGS